MSERRDQLLLSFYGDDNTGSTDAMEALAKGGVDTVLFLRAPEPQALARFPGVQAVGVAGMSRTMSPDAMEAELAPAFTRLAALGARLCHYKICSTFDSSPTVGSIGRGIDIGARVFGTAPVPLIVGAPVLRRYTLFGNLFASVGQDTFRIDRHPTMSRHPVTPMNEGDLRVHLGRQTDKRIDLMDILHLSGSRSEMEARHDAVRAGGAQVVLFDVLDDARLFEAGRLVWRQASAAGRAFVVGSSGVEYALVSLWRELGFVPQEPARFPPVAPVEQILAVSGSCSPVTGGQLAWVLDHERGFVGIDADAERLLDPATERDAHAAAVRKAAAVWAEGKSPLVYTARGPSDPRIARAQDAWQRRGGQGGPGTAIGEALGQIARAVLEAVSADGGRRPGRILVAGGDTSGHTARQIGVEALKIFTTTAPGSPICRAYSADPLVDGVEIILKGGQVGEADYIENLKTGAFT